MTEPLADHSRAAGALERGWSAVRSALRGEAIDYTRGPLARAIFLLAVPMVLEMAMESTFAICDVWFVSRLGDSAVAGYTIAIRIVVFAILPSWGLANAAATFVGQNLGARRPERAERSVIWSGWANTAFLAMVTVVFVSLDEELVSIFTDREETIRYGADALRIVSYGYVFYAWGMVLAQAFNGAGDTATPTKINFFGFWIVQVPLAWCLARTGGFGPQGVFWSVAIAESLITLAAAVLFRRGKWKETRIAPDPKTAEPPVAPSRPEESEPRELEGAGPFT